MAESGSPCKLDILIPAFNEELSIAHVLRGLKQADFGLGVEARLIVIDNDSNDSTARVSSECGALVVHEPERGYGSACLRGMQEVASSDIVLFLDADGSDELSVLSVILEPILSNKADFVVGSRVLGQADRGALLAHQKFGNVLAAFLLRLLYRQKITDLGPCRAIRTKSLISLGMQDRDYGWTVEMQIKAFRNKLRYTEVAVPYHRRYAGESKVAGNMRASFLAGKKILSLVFAEFAYVLFSRGRSGVASLRWTYGNKN